MAFAKKDRNISIGVYTLFVLAIFLAAFIFYIIASNQKYFESKYPLYMFLPNVEGLIPGAFITLSGLKVGVVGKMEFTEKDGQQGIIVELQIDRDYQERITTSSVAMVKTMGILGDKYIDITLGELGERVLEEDEFITSNPGIDAYAVFADAAASLTDLKNVLQNTDSLTGEVMKGRGILGQLVVDNPSSRDFARIIVNLEQTTGMISGGKGSIGKLIQDPVLYSNLSRSSEDLHSILNNLNQGKGTAGQLLTDSTLYARIQAVSSKTDSLLSKLQHDDGTVGKLINDKQFYENLLNLSGSLDSLSTDMKKNPQRYINVSVF